jgi:hypothetical protein
VIAAGCDGGIDTLERDIISEVIASDCGRDKAKRGGRQNERLQHINVSKRATRKVRKEMKEERSKIQAGPTCFCVPTCLMCPAVLGKLVCAGT